MRLISCYIENYGVISRREYKFDGNFTQFLNDNGTGKSTLASFIKAMFYGLPSYRTNAKTFDDRQHFYPFNGGKFGGNLTFEKGGAVYRIERFFDKKSDTKDELVVYRGAAVTKEFGGDIGKAVFGLDENSFARTVFVTAAETDGGSTSDINARLNQYVLSTESEDSFDKAAAMLEERRKSYKAARGGGGLIDRAKAECRQLKDDIGQLEAIERGLAPRYEERKRLSDEIGALEERQKRANESRLVNEKWATYDRYTEEIGEKRGALAALAQRYPKGLPAAEEIAGAQKKCVELANLESVIENIAFDGRKEQRLGRLLTQFADGVPDGQTLKVADEKAESVAVLSAEIAREENAPRDKRAERLADVFRSGLPDGEEVAKIRAAAERYKADDARLKEAAMPSAKKKSFSAKYAVIAAFAAALCIAGAALCFIALIAGVIVAAAGVVLLFADAFLYLKRRTEHPAAGAAEEIRARLRQEEQTIRAFLAPYGYYSESVLADLAAFLTDEADHRANLADGAARREELDGKKKMCAEMTEEVESLLRRYGQTDGTLRERLAALRADVADFTALSGEKNAADEKRAALLSRSRSVDESLRAWLGAYGLPFTGKAQLDTLSDDRRTCDRLTAEVSALVKKAETYRVENALTARGESLPAEDTSEEVAAALAAKRRSLSLLDRQIAEDEADLERLPEKRSRLEETEELLTRYQRRYETLTDALELLKKAEQRLKDKYVAPVKERFLYYADKIEKALGEKMVMDEDFRVSFERGGEIRSEKHLSAGQRSVCNLCLRLALVDNMYTEEKPFIIMDDPFVHLDAANMVGAAKVLKSLSEDRQIIYFCCHKSRAIEA